MSAPPNPINIILWLIVVVFVIVILFIVLKFLIGVLLIAPIIAATFTSYTESVSAGMPVLVSLIAALI